MLLLVSGSETLYQTSLYLRHIYGYFDENWKQIRFGKSYPVIIRSACLRRCAVVILKVCYLGHVKNGVYQVMQMQ